MKDFVIRHKVISCICGLLVLIILVNGFWLLYVYQKYTPLSRGMQEDIKLQSYNVVENEYIFNVKYPNYLSFTGNVAVATADEKIALIIWPGLFGNEYRIQIEDDGVRNDVTVGADKRAQNPLHQEMLDKHREGIDIIFDRAKAKWPGLFK